MSTLFFLTSEILCREPLPVPISWSTWQLMWIVIFLAWEPHRGLGKRDSDFIPVGHGVMFPWLCPMFPNQIFWCSFYSGFLCILGFLCSCMSFKIALFCEGVIVIRMRTALNLLEIALSSVIALTILILSIHEYGMSLHLLLSSYIFSLSVFTFSL